MTKGRIARIALAVLTLILTVTLCLCALRVYREGIRARMIDPVAVIYSPERVKDGMRAVLPATLAWLAGIAFAGVLSRGEIRHKPAVAGFSTARKCLGKLRDRAPSHRRVLGWLRGAALALALALIVLGILNGGLNDVLVKAVNLCTECIGLG